MTFRLNKNIFLLNLSLILLIIGFGLHYVNYFNKYNLSGSTKIENQLADFRNDFSQIHETILNSDSLKIDSYFEEHHNQSFTLLYYQNDTLQFWSKNDVVLDPGKVYRLQNTEQTIKLKKGYYNIIKKQYEETNNIITLIGLLPVYLEHEIENKYIQHKFNDIFELNGNYAFHPTGSSNFKSNYKHITNPEGAYLFSISSNVESLKKYSTYSIILFALGLITLLIYLTSLALFYLNQQKTLYGYIVISLGILLVSVLVMLLHYIPGFDDLLFFDPTLYASSRFLGSIGDLFLHLVLTTWFTAFIYSNFKIEILQGLKSNTKLLVFSIAHLILVLAAIYIAGLIKSIVIDSTINFDVRTLFETENFFNLLLAFICIMLMLSTFYFLYQTVLNISKTLGISLKTRILLVFGIVPLGFGLEYILVSLINYVRYSETIFNNGYAINGIDIKQLFAFILIIGAYVFQMSERRSIKRDFSLNFTFLWLSFSCLFASSYIYMLDARKEKVHRKQMILQLSQGNDPSTEGYLSNKIQLIEKDPYFPDWVKDKFKFKKTLDNYIIRTYFQDYVSGFDITTHIYNGSGKYHIKSTGTPRNDLLEKKISSAEQTSINENLWRSVTRANQYEYLIELEIEDPDSKSKVAYLYIEIIPTAIEKILVYPELLQSKNRTNRNANISDEYSYARYKKDKFDKKAGVLSYIQKGDYNFPINFTPYFSPPQQPFDFFDKDGFSHLIYKVKAEEEYLVLSKEVFDLIGPISLFSFVYLIAIVLLGLVWLIYLSITSILYNKNPFTFFLSSFRRRVNLSMLALLLFSFFLTGVIITVFLIRQFDNVDKDRLLTKRDAVEISFKNEIAEQRISDGNFIAKIDSNFLNRVHKSRLSFVDQKKEIRKELVRKQQQMSSTLDSLSYSISKVHGVDINIYNPKGNLIGSSLRTVFDKELLTEKINPTVLNRLVKEQKQDFEHEEKIGELAYTSAYFQLKDNIDDKLLAIVNIPYILSDDKALQKEVTDFILALVNVYVFLFILGSIIALMISKTLTNSLTKVGDKMQTFRLGQKHDPIQWNYDDEIGRLINGYNQMIEELDDSAKMLAQSERQSAWRQMARQVAHEIKNPLTPMKLSIQHLQRALKDDSPQVKDLTIKVSKTLVEQIENLANIASVFSSFAKMPKAENAVLNINELLANVIPLYASSEEVIDINFDKPAENWLVYSDKNQLVQVFNNLIKNAIQSIPKEKEGIIEVSSIRNNGIVHIAFKDNGSGIPPEIQDKVFTPNFTTKGSGMGLGLAITKQIIEQSDGKISFETAMDVGTTFYIELPIYNEINT